MINIETTMIVHLLVTSVFSRDMSKVLVLAQLEERVGTADVMGTEGVLLAGQSIQSIIPVCLPKGLLIPLSVSAANGCCEQKQKASLDCNVTRMNWRNVVAMFPAPEGHPHVIRHYLSTTTLLTLSSSTLSE